MLTEQIRALYRKERARQMEAYNMGHPSICTDQSGRREYTYGGAAYGLHAYAAFMSAKRHAYFVNTYAENYLPKKRTRKGN